MGLRDGYRLTEVGVIPEDWEIVPLGLMGNFSKGQGIRKNEASSGNIPCVRYGEIYTLHNDIIRNFFSNISGQVAKSSKRLKKGDLLFTGSGETKEEIGKCVAFIDDIESYAGGDIVILSPIKKDSRFLAYLLNSPIIKVQKASKGQGDAIVHISSSALSSIKLPLPPTLKEQQAIADVLSDTDNLIEALERLISKKRLVKLGVMQELLRPKEGWIKKQLGEIVKIVMGQSPSSIYYNNKGYGLPLIQGNSDIFNRKTIKRIFTTKINKYGQCGDILLSVRAPVGEISLAVFDVCLGRGVCAFNYPNKFLYHTLIAKEPTWIKLSKGSTFDSINSIDVKTFEIDLPSDEKEQQAIADVLTNLDDEITALEIKLSKIRAVKHGMMEQLLTGKIRLVK